MTTTDATGVLTPEFRVSYPTVFQAKLNKLNGKQEFGLMALFKKGENLNALKVAAAAACVKKWGADKSKWPANLRSPFRDQKEKAKGGVLPDGHAEGAIFMTLRSESRPKVVDQNLQEIIEPSKFYAGCWARAHINAFAYSQMGNNGVSFGLNHLQFVRDGDAFSARPRVEDAFTAIDTGANGAGETTAGDLF